MNTFRLRLIVGLTGILIVLALSCKKENTPPIADFSFSPAAGNVDTVFTFDASACFDEEDEPSVLQVHWDWNNDGIWDTDLSSNKVINHKFNDLKENNVVLEVVDTEGLVTSIMKTITTKASLPVVDVVTVSDIDQDVAQASGRILKDGGAMVTVRGFCWSKDSGPTIANEKTENGSGTGSFSSMIVDLQPDTEYKIRGYATNSTGTAYGDQSIFRTSPQPVLPSVMTRPVTNISLYTAQPGGVVIDDGGAIIQARGICWSTDTQPTIMDNRTIDGTGLGEFISGITGLTADTEYYVRAYATNKVGTGYGESVSFRTDDPRGTITDERDGSVYTTIWIGNQRWLAENLAYVQHVSPSDQEGGIWVYGYEGSSVSEAKATDNYTTYGCLYNWDYATDASICPQGWHVPTDKEWKTLEEILGMTSMDVNKDGDDRISGVVGKKLKSTGGWIENGNGDNSSYFNALPSGYRSFTPGYFSIGARTYFWSTTQYPPLTAHAYNRSLLYNSLGVGRPNDDKRYGFAIRCVSYK